MNATSLITLFTCAALLMLPAKQALSQGLGKQLVGHVFYGIMTMSEDAVKTEGLEPEEEDFDTFIFGADAQKSIYGDLFQYGFETGILFSIDSSVRNFRASSGSSGGTVALSVDVNSILIDYFAGGFLSFEPTRWFRFYLGAGPLIIWSSWSTKPEDSGDEETPSQSDAGFGVGGYARAEIDIFLTEKIGINAGVRLNETTLSLKNTVSEIDVEGWQYYGGLALHF